MKFFNSDYFKYIGNRLYCEDVPLNEITAKTATPVFIYSKKYFTDRYKKFSQEFNDIDHKIFFAAKANFNLNVIKIFSDLGAGIDVNSAGELYKALKAGVTGENIILSGVGKTKDEILLGLKNNVDLIKAESFQEIILINQLAKKLRKTANIAIRINPNVDPATHPYISTGLSENKFGIDFSDAIDTYKEAKKLQNINLVGIDMHIGSQITKIEPYLEAVDNLSEVFFKLKEIGINIYEFDLGGGIGVVYNNEKEFPLKQFAKQLKPKLKKLKCKILFEPGRYLTANGGVIVTEVLYTKKNKNKNFIIVDAAMTELLRPSLYGAYHHIQPVNIENKSKSIFADVVGPVCESGDYFAKNREISVCKPGDLLSIMSAGAYAFTMASNYNARRKAAEVLVDGSNFHVIRKRESFENLIANERLISEVNNI